VVVPLGKLYNVWLKANLFAGRILHKGDFNITRFFGIKVPFGSAP
jgi:hypothetical protein